jgi:hypothetical protein
MVSKKSEREPVARGRLSLVSRLLGGALRVSLQASPPLEPWRTGKPGSKYRGKRHK